MIITACVVLYNTNENELHYLIENIKNCTLDIFLYLVDNSPEPTLSKFGNTGRAIEYIHNGKNIGYGKAHNVAIERAILNGSKISYYNYPDISFEENNIEKIFDYMQNDEEVGQLMPKVLYKDGTLQRLCKCLPTPFDLIGRRFFKKSSWAIKRNKVYELDNFNYNEIINCPNLSGCFMFIRTSVLEKVNGFDPRYFMYMEDIDLTRRIHEIAENNLFSRCSSISWISERILF